MPIEIKQLKEYELKKSSYGCGRESCYACYPVQYLCEYCLVEFAQPIENGEIYTCPECDWVANGNN